MFSCEICEISKNIFFDRTPPVAAYKPLKDTFYVCFWPVRNMATLTVLFLILKTLSEFIFSLKRILKKLKHFAKQGFRLYSELKSNAFYWIYILSRQKDDPLCT